MLFPTFIFTISEHSHCYLSYSLLETSKHIYTHTHTHTNFLTNPRLHVTSLGPFLNIYNIKKAVPNNFYALNVRRTSYLSTRQSNHSLHMPCFIYASIVWHSFTVAGRLQILGSQIYKFLLQDGKLCVKTCSRSPK